MNMYFLLQGFLGSACKTKCCHVHQQGTKVKLCGGVLRVYVALTDHCFFNCLLTPKRGYRPIFKGSPHGRNTIYTSLCRTDVTQFDCEGHQVLTAQTGWKSP